MYPFTIINECVNCEHKPSVENTWMKMQIHTKRENSPRGGKYHMGEQNNKNPSSKYPLIRQCYFYLPEN